MSETITTNSLPLVSMLDNDDTLLSAKGKRISVDNFKARIINRVIDETPQWIRVAKFAGQAGATGVFTIYNIWGNRSPDPLMIAYAFPSSQLNAATATRINVLAGSSPVFTKARIVYPAEYSGAIKPCYLDIYHAQQEKGIRVIENIHSSQVTICNEPGGIPEGYTSAEISLEGAGVNFRGGVKRCILYAVRQKGGQHERGYDSYQRHTQIADAGRYGVQRIFHEWLSRRFHSKRNLPITRRSIRMDNTIHSSSLSALVCISPGSCIAHRIRRYYAETYRPIQRADIRKSKATRSVETVVQGEYDTCRVGRKEVAA